MKHLLKGQRGLLVQDSLELPKDISEWNLRASSASFYPYEWPLDLFLGILAVQVTY